MTYSQAKGKILLPLDYEEAKGFSFSKHIPTVLNRTKVSIPDSLIIEIGRLLLSGFNRTEVANRLGIDRKTIYRWMKRIGFKVPHLPNAKKPHKSLTHGMLSTYQYWKCRCELCTEANRERLRRQKKKKSEMPLQKSISCGSL